GKPRRRGGKRRSSRPLSSARLRDVTAACGEPPVAPLELLDGLFDSCQRRFLSENLERLEQRRGILSPADGYSDRLEHLSGFYAHRLGVGAEGLVQGIVFEFRLRQDFPSAGQNFERHGGVALLRDEFGGVVGWKLVIINEKKVGGGKNVAQKFDALADARGDGLHFLRRNWESGAVDDGKQAGGEVVDRKPADVFSIQPEGFRVEGFFGVGVLRLRGNFTSCSS